MIDSATIAPASANQARPVARGLWSDDKSPPRFPPCDLLIGSRPLREGNDPIDQRSLEGAVLKHGGERLEQGSRCDRIAMAGVDAEELPLIVVEVKKIEADAPIANRC